jgi:hypothetical protein
VARIELETFVAAPAERCFDLSLSETESFA